MAHVHESHPQIVNRLKRANGHLAKIIAMIEEGTPCVEVSRQLQAVYNAVGNAKSEFVRDHIEGCLTAENATAAELKTKMVEIKEISRYL